MYVNAQMAMGFWSLLVGFLCFPIMNKNCIYVPIFMSCVNILVYKKAFEDLTRIWYGKIQHYNILLNIVFY
jgi:hypothetical protein